jgi:hypothetical protein
LTARRCGCLRVDEQSCRTRPTPNEPYCFLHHPDFADVVAAARRVAGQRKRQEGSMAIALGLTGLRTIEEGQRVLDDLGYTEEAHQMMLKYI